MQSNLKKYSVNIDWLSEKDEWANLNGVGMLVCEKTVKKTGKKSVEQRYFLTSVTDVQRAAFAMRAHWGTENNLHWALDAILDEDYCLVRCATNEKIASIEYCRCYNAESLVTRMRDIDNRPFFIYS